VFDVLIGADGRVVSVTEVEGDGEPVVVACFIALLRAQQFNPPHHAGGRMRGARVRVPIRYGHQ
jgi:hypothetical protein